MIVALDGLWFLNVLKEIGDEKAFELDVRVFISQFKKATRVWREMNGLDGKSTADKVSVFQAMAHLYGHRFEVTSGEGRVTMRLTQCSFLENLKRAGRTPEHDCRRLCSKLGPAWFAEIEPRTGGAARSTSRSRSAATTATSPSSRRTPDRGPRRAAACLGLHDPREGLRAGFDPQARRVDREVRFPVERPALREDRLELRHRVGTARHRALVALAGHPFPMLPRSGPQPDGDARAPEERRTSPGPRRSRRRSRGRRHRRPRAAARAPRARASGNTARRGPRKSPRAASPPRPRRAGPAPRTAARSPPPRAPRACSCPRRAARAAPRAARAAPAGLGQHLDDGGVEGVRRAARGATGRCSRGRLRPSKGSGGRGPRARRPPAASARRAPGAGADLAAEALEKR